MLRTETYPYLDTEYEDVTTTEYASHVTKGDRVHNVEVGDVKVGTKWVDIRHADGNRIVRLERTDPIEITKRRQTQASRDADLRVERNRGIIRQFIETEDNRVENELNDASVRNNEGWSLTHSDIAGIIEANATAYVRAIFVGGLNARASQDDYTGDCVDVLDETIEILKNRLVSESDLTRGLSRSTSQVQNLMNDALREAMAKFIRDARWY